MYFHDIRKHHYELIIAVCPTSSLASLGITRDRYDVSTNSSTNSNQVMIIMCYIIII